MTEPLGQSQVLPYMIGLAAQGVGVEILSFEPTGTPRDTVEALGRRLKSAGVAWRPLTRSPSHGVGRKAWEIGTAFARGLGMALQRAPDIVHARSYLPAAAADAIATIVPGARMLFDLRGMLGDEYVDGGNWKRESLRYRVIKIYERRLFRSADGVVVLTRALLRHLRRENAVADATPIRVIPCCVDTDRFGIDLGARARTRRALGLEGKTVVVYSGTLGAWYMAKEMASFVAALQRRRADVAWLVLTHADPSELMSHARAAGIKGEDLVVQKAVPADMPSLLAAGDIGLSFIRPCFSKMGASPTKVAEYLSCGLLAVVNDSVGDMGELAETDGCVLVPGSLREEDIERAALDASSLVKQPFAQRAEVARRLAVERYSLRDVGVPSYAELYATMCSASCDTVARPGGGPGSVLS